MLGVGLRKGFENAAWRELGRTAIVGGGLLRIVLRLVNSRPRIIVLNGFLVRDRLVEILQSLGIFAHRRPDAAAQRERLRIPGPHFEYEIKVRHRAADIPLSKVGARAKGARHAVIGRLSYHLIEGDDRAIELARRDQGNSAADDSDLIGGIPLEHGIDIR